MHDIPGAERAARLGIMVEYRDGLGQHRAADPEALVFIVEALSHGDRQTAGAPIPGTCVLRAGNRRLQVHSAADREVAWAISSDSLVMNGIDRGPEIALAAELAPGSYRLEVSLRSDH